MTLAQAILGLKHKNTVSGGHTCKLCGVLEIPEHTKSGHESLNQGTFESFLGFWFF